MKKNRRFTPTNKEIRENNAFTGDSQYDTALRYLGDIEDIEEELGIDLITLFMALEMGIFCITYDDDDEYLDHHNVRGISKDGLIVKDDFCDYPECDFLVSYEDYGKTWALTKKELEDDN